MKVLDLFAGIGGFTIGLERAGFETVAFCEIDSYAQKVLKKNWPGVPIYDDVRTITAERLISDGIRVDVITGGFPCQDISVAGKKAGIEGERSGLWSECARLIRELQPRYAIFENVTNLLNGERGAWFKRVLWDISALGYDAEWHCIPASELGAHHHRDRIWIIAYPNRSDDTRVNGGSSERGGQITPKRTEYVGRGGGEQNVADTISDRSGNNNARSGAGRSGAESKDLQQENRQAYTSHSGSSGEVVAYPGSERAECLPKNDKNQKRATECRAKPSGSGEDVADTDGKRLQGRTQKQVLRKRDIQEQFMRSRENDLAIWATEPNVGRVANGIPSRTHRLKCLGNAVVPPIPELIGRAILQQYE